MKRALLAVFAAFAAFLALASAPPPTPSRAQSTNQAVFCNGTYALCIKAPCVPIVTLDRLGNYYVDHAACSCEVEKGWSMGPGQCADRGPVTHKGRTFMISTYSNMFNAMHGTLQNTLRCTAKDTLWAWCYGAPCVVDPNHPDKATCNCPVETGPMQTLGGDCQQANCGNVYSAATIAGDAFANKHFADYMKTHKYPFVPPAQLCAGSPPVRPQ